MQIDDCSVHFSYEGDMAEVSQWISKSKQVFRWMRKQGLTNHYQKVSDTVEIFAQYLPPRLGRIRIKAGEPLKLVSGLVDIQFPPKPIISEVDPIFELTDSKGNPYKAIKSLYPRNVNGSSSTYGPWGESKEVAKNWISDNIPGHPNSFIWKTPGKYSGKMRKVVQLLIGLGHPVPYEYKSYLCHGIFTTAKGTPWVIEVSRARGIRAWKLPIAKTLDPSDTTLTADLKEIANDLGYLPKYVNLSAQSSKNVVTLLSQEAFYTASGKEAYFDSCGWAFNSTGHELQNTFWLEDEVQTNYIRGYRYKISIGEFDDKPNTAFLSLVESDLVYGDRINGFKVPSEVLSTLVNFDYYTAITRPSGTYNGPLYVFYDKSDNEVVARTQTEVANTPYISTELPSPGFPDWINPDYLGTNVNSSGNQFAFPVPVVDGYTSQILNFRGSRDFYDVELLDTWSGLIADSSFSGTGNLWGPEAVRTTGNGSINSDYGQYFYNTIVVPFFEREAIYVFIRRQEIVYSGYTKYLGQTQWWRGQNLSRGVYDTAINLAAPCGGIDGSLSWRPQFAVEIVGPPSTPGITPNWTHCGGTFYAIYPGTSFSAGDKLCAIGWIDISSQTLAGINIIQPSSTTNFDSLAVITKDGIVSLEIPLNGDDFVEFWDGSNTKFMEVIQDAFGNSKFLSKDVDNSDWTMYDDETGNYPINEFISSMKQRFYVGKP